MLTVGCNPSLHIHCICQRGGPNDAGAFVQYIRGSGRRSVSPPWGGHVAFTCSVAIAPLDMASQFASHEGSIFRKEGLSQRRAACPTTGSMLGRVVDDDRYLGKGDAICYPWT